jgi:predicted nucleic acid-binding protein
VDLVVDASVVLQILLAGAGLGRLRNHSLHAPALLPSEVTSSLRELVWRGDAPEAASIGALRELATMPIVHEPPGTLAVDATAVAAQLGWAKTYDAEYVALARRLDCPLLTIDARLQRGVGGLIEVLTPLEL